MSIFSEIARTIDAIRRAGDVDVERLCFEVTETEWKELLGWLDQHGWNPNMKHGDVVQSPEHMMVMGIRVRRASPSGRADSAGSETC